MKKHIFDGIKIIEITSGMVGPWATTYFANHGAKVVLLESMTALSISRTTMPFKDNKPGVNNTGFGALLSPNRHSMSLNLRHQRSWEVKKRLVEWADVIIENYAPGVMERWGLSYDEVRRIKPDIIMARASSQGQTGPYANHPAYGFQLSSLCGFSHITGWPDGEPQSLAGAYTDTIAPRFLAIAIIAALDFKRKTGKGQLIDLSELEASLEFLIPPLLDYSVNGKIASRMANVCHYAAPHQVYQCRGEDRWCAITVFTDRQWISFCTVIGDPPWTKEFSTLQKRKQQEGELDRRVEEWTVNHSAEEITEMMQHAGVPAAVVESPEDICQDPQLKARNAMWSLDHVEMGPTPHFGQFFELSKCPPKEPTPYPCLGQDTEYVCKNFLGFSEEEFDNLLVEDVFE
ncbi:MAG: CoA transferase [Pseudomonadota bacterium]